MACAGDLVLWLHWQLPVTSIACDSISASLLTACWCSVSSLRYPSSSWHWLLAPVSRQLLSDLHRDFPPSSWYEISRFYPLQIPSSLPYSCHQGFSFVAFCFTFESLWQFWSLWSSRSPAYSPSFDCWPILQPFARTLAFDCRERT